VHQRHVYDAVVCFSSVMSRRLLHSHCSLIETGKLFWILIVLCNLYQRKHYLLNYLITYWCCSVKLCYVFDRWRCVCPGQNQQWLLVSVLHVCLNISLYVCVSFYVFLCCFDSVNGCWE